MIRISDFAERIGALEPFGGNLMRRPQPSKRQAKRVPSLRQWGFTAGALLAVVATSAVLLRHKIPDILALLDSGPAPIAATSLSDQSVRKQANRAHSPTPTAHARKSPTPTSADDRPQAGSEPSPFQTQASTDAVAIEPVPRKVGFGPLDDGIKMPTLTVAVWTFNAPDLKPIERDAPAWRTSFGSERVARASHSAAAGFDADLIAVTGIRDFQLFRRMFPARDYFVITPPQLRQQSLIQRRHRKPFAFPTVAIVLRRGAGLLARQRVQRVFSGRGFFRTELDAELSGLSADLGLAGDDQSLPFALNVIAHGTRFWFVVANLVQDCETEAHCQSQQSRTEKLKTWLTQQQEQGTPVLLATEFAGVARWRAVRPSARPLFSVGAHGGISASDEGCTRPKLALETWLPATIRNVGHPTSAGSAPDSSASSAEQLKAKQTKAEPSGKPPKSENFSERPLTKADVLWRARGDGTEPAGDCVLMARMRVAPRKIAAPSPTTASPVDPLFKDLLGDDAPSPFVDNDGTATANDTTDRE